VVEELHVMFRNNIEDARGDRGGINYTTSEG
jgi:hypothetical protein